jgi:hypothetical protein
MLLVISLYHTVSEHPKVLIRAGIVAPPIALLPFLPKDLAHSAYEVLLNIGAYGFTETDGIEIRDQIIKEGAIVPILQMIESPYFKSVNFL